MQIANTTSVSQSFNLDFDTDKKPKTAGNSDKPILLHTNQTSAVAGTWSIPTKCLSPCNVWAVAVRQCLTCSTGTGRCLRRKRERNSLFRNKLSNDVER